MRRSGSGGQALVEWAIVLPATLLLTLGIIQFALVLMGKVVINHAAFSAARAQLVGEDPLLAARIVCSPVAGTRAPSGADPIALPGWGALPRSEFSVVKTSVEVTSDDEDAVTVAVTHDLELWFPLVDLLFRSGVDGAGTPYLRLTEKCTLPRLWTQDGDLGLPES